VILEAGGTVYGTHHIGGSTAQAQAAIAQETVQIVKEYLRTGHVRNCVNLAESPARSLITVRHRNRPGVLAHTLNAISHAGVNVEEMGNVICEGGESACAHIKLDGPLGDDVLTEIQTGNEHIIAVTLTPLSER
jgi:D-3-phosphoglycerate dehydrogenase